LFDSEKDWPNPLRLILYLMGLGYTFLGVAIISDIFMNGIEKITSSKKRVQNKATGRLITVYVWNATVANLTLMALGSSAPEILLSLIEITIGKFQLGPLGAGTIVGSAAFNLLCISAVCVLAIPDGEVRYIKEVPVYVVTSTCSVFAYLWLMFIMMGSSPDVCEIWEGVITLLFTPMIVVAAYVADRGYCSRRSTAYEEQDDNRGNSAQTLSDDVSVEELAAIEHEIREQHGAQLTSEQVVKIMQATYFQKRSRAYYRHAALKAGLYGKDKDKKMSAMAHAGSHLDRITCRNIQEAIDTVDDVEAERAANEIKIGFVAERYCVVESCGDVTLTVMRSGQMDEKVTVKYTTRDGTATGKDDFGKAEGILTFEKGEVEQTVKISIMDDVAYEDDEEFYVDLSEPTCEGPEKFRAVLGTASATVVIIDDDQPGMLRFKQEEMEVQDEVTSQVLGITVERFNGATGTISCRYNTDSMGAVDGIDFEGAKGIVEFPPAVQTANIQVTIKPRGRLDNTSFLVVLTDPKGTKFDDKTDGGDEKCICNVKICGKKGETRQALLRDMRDRAISANAIMGSRNWVNQFKDAIFQVGDEDEEEDEDTDEKEAEGKDGPSIVDYFMHFCSMPWKLLFAFVPPPDYCGGWATFSCSLLMIAIVTAVVADLANLVGCCLDILPETAAITFVALGTSLPDTFASKAAAMMDPYADASIGNITGSNSINVFMGIGLAWTIAAFRWELGERNSAWDETLSYLNAGERDNVLGMLSDSKAAVFITPAGTIWFNLMVFSVNAFFAIQHLLQRRRRFGGELGGPKKGFFGQYFSAFFLVGQWFLYITASVIFARSQDGALTYGQIAVQEAASMA